MIIMVVVTYVSRKRGYGGMRSERRPIREVIPFVAALVSVLLLITYIPWLVLFLPNLIMGKGPQKGKKGMALPGHPFWGDVGTIAA